MLLMNEPVAVIFGILQYAPVMWLRITTVLSQALTSPECFLIPVKCE